jgi:hypothetical protein
MNDTNDIQEALAKLRRREMKEAVQEGIKQFLDEQAAKFGRWSFRFLIALLLSALLYGAMIQAGWSPPNLSVEQRR